MVMIAMAMLQRGVFLQPPRVVTVAGLTLGRMVRGDRRVCCMVGAVVDSSGDADSPRLGKRKVALFVGYDGTHYRGLQMQPSQLHLSSQEGRSKTIEEVLESAIFKSGGILESNRGNLGKVGWSRSSRTDKRVHSVSTVISMKLECNPDVFESEPDGGSIAQGINEHLPPEVRVFAVQRVVKSFDARRECIKRYYEYYVPVSFFSLMIDREKPLQGIHGSTSQKEELKKVLEQLAVAWSSYKGHHAFHNFTKRRLYRPERDAGSPDERENTKQEPREADSKVRHEKGKIHFQWKAERDERDPIVRSHYRYIEDCHCSIEPIELVDRGGEPCVKLSVCGASFMLHQIRHMVGGAVLVALGKIPLKLLKASMAPPVRMNLPLAPPGTLVLRGADFGTFRKSYDGKPSVTERSSGSSLVLLPEGQKRQQEFERSVLYHGLHEQLQHDDWNRWSDSLSLVQYDTVEADSIMEKSIQWLERREEMKMVRRRLREESSDDSD